MRKARTESPSDRLGRVVGFATTAYRADAVRPDRWFGEHEAEWIAIATLLEQAARLPDVNAAPMLQHVESLAAAVVSPAVVDELVSREWQSTERAPSDAIVAIAEEAHNRNAYHLGAHILDALLAANRSLSDVQRGRMLAKRARIAYKTGDMLGAADRYAQIRRLARASGNAELGAYGWVGRAIVAQIHGNYPEVWRCARCAARIADHHGFRSLSCHAHNRLMIVAGTAGRINAALAHGWRAYEAAAGQPAREAEVLANMSQALLDSGHVREARAGFAAVIAKRDLPAQIVIPPLGGFAVASAMLGDEPRVLWAAREVRRLERSGGALYHIASSMLDCATAFVRIGQSAAAAQHAAAARRIARAHGFHEIAFKAESLKVASPSPTRVRRMRLSARGAAVARDVERLEPHGLPAHVAVASAVNE